MSADHNYAGPDDSDSVVGKGEESTSLELNENCVSDHAYAIEVEEHNSEDCTASSSRQEFDADLESNDADEAKLEEEEIGENNSELNMNNSAMEEEEDDDDDDDDDVDDKLLVDEDGEDNTDAKETMLENKTDVHMDGTEEDGEIVDNENVKSCEVVEENMSVTENSKEVNKGDVNLHVKISRKKLDDDFVKKYVACASDTAGESSNKGEISMPVSEDEESSTGNLIGNISDHNTKPEESDASDNENESDDEQILLLSPVTQEKTESDAETMPESAVDASLEGDSSQKSPETNNNCLTDKLSSEKPVDSETKSTVGEIKKGDDKEQTVTADGQETGSETTEDYSVNTDSRGKFDDDAMESGDENGSVKDQSKTVESKEMEVQASLNDLDADSGEDTEVTTGVGRKRKKPASFGEFLTNDEEIDAEVKRTKKLDGDSDTPRRGRTSTVVTTDLETLLEPFKHGWMRELVYRSTGNTACDTYYFAPEGRKLRSLVQVADYLESTNSPLTVNNFSFSRRVLHKPPFELVRQAGRVGIPSKKGSPSPVSKSKTSPKVTPGGVPRRRPGRPPKNKSPKVIETKTRPATKFSDVEVIIERDSDEVSLPSLDVVRNVSSPPAPVLTVVSTSSPSVVKDTKTVTTSNKNVVLIKQEQTIDFNISTLLNSNTASSPTESDDLPRKKMVARKSTTPRPKQFKPDAMSKTPNNSEGEATEGLSSNQLCTLACPGLEGRPPTLQCASCICLFHPQCVNFQGGGEFYCYICVQIGKKSTVPTTVKYKSPALYGIASQSTPKTSVSMNIQNVASQAVQMIYHSQSSTMSPAPSLYTLKLTPNNGLVSDGLIPSLQHASSPGIIHLPALQLPESVSAKSALRTALDKRIQSPVSSLYKPTGLNSTALISTAACTSISSAVPALPTLISAGVLSANNADMTSPSKTLQSKIMPAPPRLTLAPGIIPPVSMLSDIPSSQSSNVFTSKSSNSDIPLNAQLLTLPKAVTKRLKLSQPLALKINNIQVVVPPSCVIGSADGLKVLLPPNTFPLPTDPNQKLSVTVSNNTDPEVNKLTEPLLQTPSRTGVEKSETNKRPFPGSAKKERKKKGINPASCFIKSLYGGYDCMLEIFKYLKTADLLRASCVCRTWQQISKQSCLWRTVSLRGLTITNWDKATAFFKNVRLESLSLMGMCHSDDRNKTWHNLMSNLHNLAGLTTIEFGLVPAAVLHMVCEKLPGLEVFRAEFISDASGDQMWSTPCKTYMGKFAALKQLKELKLRGIGGLTLPTFSFSGGLTELGSLEHLVSLSLTTLRSVSDNEFHFLREMNQLTELELGDCTNWSSEIYFILGGLTNLTKLRLECGGEIPDIGLADMLQNLKNLEILELIMFQIADTFENSLGQLEKLHTLVIWPDTTTEAAAAVNSSTLMAVSKLKNLKHLEWGVVSSETSTDSSGTEKQTEYIPILPQCGNQAENSDMVLLSERISIIQLTEKLCVLLPQVSIRVFNTKVVPHSPKNGSS
ncbi:uncharacterized protein LOC121371051 [Gigantopelta aegis]|uniref:uncharacterized protein LOC121371051 n=1 Tax=Gigantopelta aegis TaxID=1735272 RepID=UPI001B88E47A|nr:uncharacterized protein LOC121371051 [Gigantopelta aegis]